MTSGFDDIVFVLGAHNLKQLPDDVGAEVAFAGRSNAGKSSAINSITRRRGLARTSKTPGRTREINVFDVAPGARLVDLPGYGYAKVSEKMRRHWQMTLGNYLRQRRSLRGLVLLMDIRHPMKDYDRAMLQWCDEVNMPLHVLLTKADKLSRSAGLATLRKVVEDMGPAGMGCEVQLFSALKDTGVEQVRKMTLDWLAP